MEGFTRTESAKQSLLHSSCPPPSDRAIPVLWQNLVTNVYRTHIAAHGRSPPPHRLCLVTACHLNRNHARQNASKYQAPVAPRTRTYLAGTCALTSLSQTLCGKGKLY